MTLNKGNLLAFSSHEHRHMNDMAKNLSEDIDILCKKATTGRTTVIFEVQGMFEKIKNGGTCTFCNGAGHTAASCSSKKKLDSMFAHDPILKLCWKLKKLEKIKEALIGA